MGTRAKISLMDIPRVDENILQKLKAGDCEIVDRLPAVVDSEVIVGQVFVWKDIQKHLGKDVVLRVYAESYMPAVEKYVMGLVQHMDNILVTIVPI